MKEIIKHDVTLEQFLATCDKLVELGYEPEFHEDYTEYWMHNGEGFSDILVQIWDDRSEEVSAVTYADVYAVNDDGEKKQISHVMWYHH